MKKIDVSLDLETWGTEPGDDLRSIGGVLFDPRAGWVGGFNNAWKDTTHGQFYQAVDNPASDPAHPKPNPSGKEWTWDGVDSFRSYPLKRTEKTVEWWDRQSAQAQAAFANPMELRQGLILFGGWLRGLSGDTYDPNDHDRWYDDDRNLWSHGAAFDPPILAAAYRACGLPVPWHYRAPRDTRTCFDMAGIDDHSALLASLPGPLGIAHHALDDAICQARAVCSAFDRVRITHHPLLDRS